MTQPTVDQLREALSVMRDLVAGVKPQQWGAETPCEEWDVAQLVTHVVSGNHLYACAARGAPGPLPAVGADLVVAFEESATAVVAALADPAAQQRSVELPLGPVPYGVALHLRITEILVHGWDLAHATGQRVTFDEVVAEQEIEFSRGALGALVRPGRRPFAPPVPAPTDASAVDRLAGLLGRDVAGTRA